ncbi:sodium channel protein Nach-like [Anabrus simplex]|uniref:sodium channel protein Nach-like n=1 Tax=Anabrus simplex TaxID=316456 RepID=UPI0035A3C3A4
MWLPQPGVRPSVPPSQERRASKYELLKTSLSYQTSQFFDNSTLHGVRYIREEGRPFCERFMWFCFTTIGGVATLIIIVSLWEKFQTNPTITGLDTDFHNWDVPFPCITLCLSNPADQEAIDEYVKQSENDNEDVKTFLTLVTNISVWNLAEFKPLMSKPEAMINTRSLPELQSQFARNCSIFENCEYKAVKTNCCKLFKPLSTEMGFCYAFNSRHATKTKFTPEYIRETDEKWSLVVGVKAGVNTGMIRLYVQSHDEIPVLDVNPQLEWHYEISKLVFSAKQTYTTEDARQLSIRQRRCVFPDEIKLDTDSMYTYGACMTQCRMRLARKMCNCVPFFYSTTAGYTVCDVEGVKCLANHADEIQSRQKSCMCDLGCMNTVYEVEKIQEGPHRRKIELSFVSWPMVRYKREVLFGWVDLLVSFGGIAGLFLGFSLLSGVEILYFFTMRACCMVMRNQNELKQLQEEYEKVEKPPLDLSLTPYFMKRDSSSKAGISRVIPIQHPIRFQELKVPRNQMNNIQPKNSVFEFLP